MENPNCKHVFFAAWGTPQYLEVLANQRENAAKIILVKGPNVGPGWELLMPCYSHVLFPGVFLESSRKDSFAHHLAAYGFNSVSIKSLNETGGFRMLNISSSLKKV
jgi:hypothetical protein